MKTDLLDKKIFTRLNSLKSKGAWFVKYSSKLFSEYRLEHRLETHPTV
jgi:hypothetical protein